MCEPLASRPTARCVPAAGTRLKSYLGDQLPQRPLVVCEITCVEHLDTGGVVPVKRGCRARTSRLNGIRGRVEPQSKVERVDRRGRRIGVRIREWRLVVDNRSRSDPGRYDECLNAEAADKVPVALSFVIGLDRKST